MSISIKLTVDIHSHLSRHLKLTQERNEVFHALNIITRTIRQSGFPITSSKYPKINKADLLNDRAALAQNRSINVAKSSSLDNSTVGKFNFRKGINNLNQSDAIVIKHGSLGQFNCLGQRITPQRIIKGHTYQGFFAQRIDSQSSKIGMLMCQTIDSRGNPQNDGILSGIEKINFNLIPNESAPSGILISLSMSSGSEYSRYVALRNLRIAN